MNYGLEPGENFFDGETNSPHRYAVPTIPNETKMSDDQRPTPPSTPMDIQNELYALTGDMHVPKQVLARLQAAKLIAQNVLASSSEAAVLAVFDHLRSASELGNWNGQMDQELH